MRIIKSRSWLRVTAAAAVAGLAVSACGTMQMGAAAITGNSRVTSGSLTAEVANLNAAYRADKAKGIKPQRPVGQEVQQVLTWLILFRIYDQIAVRDHIDITRAQAGRQLAQLSSQAATNKVTLAQYVSAGGAVPPNLTQQLGRYFAILSELESRITGGKPPATSAEQAKLQSAVARDQCLAARDLAVTVNPQYGVFDYRSYSVVPAPPTLAAAPSSSPTAKALTTPPC